MSRNLSIQSAGKWDVISLLIPCQMKYKMLDQGMEKAAMQSTSTLLKKFILLFEKIKFQLN